MLFLFTVAAFYGQHTFVVARTHTHTHTHELVHLGFISAARSRSLCRSHHLPRARPWPLVQLDARIAVQRTITPPLPARDTFQTQCSFSNAENQMFVSFTFFFCSNLSLPMEITIKRRAFTLETGASTRSRALSLA